MNPLAKLFVTLLFLIGVTSFPSHEVIGLLPFAFYPILVAALADMPAKLILSRLVMAAPIIVGIGALNPLFDRHAISMGGFEIAGGWLVFASITLKCGLTVASAILFIGTTGMDGIGESMRKLGIPRTIVLQFLLTYRYLSLLMEEVARILRAYELRAPRRNGIGKDARGSLPGGVLVRTYERGMRVYEAMKLRGFDGEYMHYLSKKPRVSDWAFVLGWGLFFGAARCIDVTGALGSIIVKLSAL
jgi:cobalt/nickel transport system permease protein